VIGVVIASIVLASIFLVPVLLQGGVVYGKMPDFTLTSWDGTRFSLSDYEGEVVLLNFMQTTNDDCVDEILELRELLVTLPEGLVVISISIGGEDEAALGAFAAAHDIDWLFAKDVSSRSVAGSYDITGVPTQVILDQNRGFVERFDGYTSSGVLYYIAEPLLDFPETDVMPDVLLTTWDGTTFTLSDFEGRVILLIFFRISCPYCMQELPELRELRQTYSENELVMISISTQDDDAALEVLATNNNMNWLVAADTANAAGLYAVQYVPTHVILDQQRQLVQRLVGGTNNELLESFIDPLLTSFLQRSDSVFVVDVAPVPILDSEPLRYNQR
jgi:peroxiredoxin